MDVLSEAGAFKLYPQEPTVKNFNNLRTQSIYTYIKLNFHEMIFYIPSITTKAHSLYTQGEAQHKQNKPKYTIPSNLLFPHHSKRTKGGGEQHKEKNPVQLGGFLFIDVPPTFPHNFSPFHLPPKKKVVKRKDCWGSEPLGQLEREQKPKQSPDVTEIDNQEV